MTAPHCAVCGDHVAPDMNYTRVVVEKRRIDDRNTETVYYLHDDCARDETEDWGKPA